MKENSKLGNSSPIFCSYPISGTLLGYCNFANDTDILQVHHSLKYNRRGRCIRRSKNVCKLNATNIYGGSSHPEGNKLVEHVEDVWIEVLREEQRLQRRAVPLNLLREDMKYLDARFWPQLITRMNWFLLFRETQMPSDSLTTGTSPFPKHLLDLKKAQKSLILESPSPNQQL